MSPPRWHGKLQNLTSKATTSHWFGQPGSHYIENGKWSLRGSVACESDTVYRDVLQVLSYSLPSTPVQESTIGQECMPMAVIIPI